MRERRIAATARVSLTGLWSEARRAYQENKSLVAAYRNGRALPSLGRRPVILVDDGLNSGLLQLAALAALRHYHPQRCIVATPCGTPSALAHIARMADELVTLTHGTGERQEAIAHWQHALGDDDAAALLLARSEISTPAVADRPETSKLRITPSPATFSG